MKRWFRSHYWHDSDAKTAFKRFLLDSHGLETYEFGFIPDRLGLEVTTEPNDDGDGTHVDGEFPFSGKPFRFPYTAHA